MNDGQLPRQDGDALTAWVGTPTHPGPATADQGFGVGPGTGPARGTPAPTGKVVPPVVTGVNTAAVVIGLICLVAAGLTIVRLLTGADLQLDRFGKPGVSLVGLALVVLGLVGLARRRRRGVARR